MLLKNKNAVIYGASLVVATRRRLDQRAFFRHKFCHDDEFAFPQTSHFMKVVFDLALGEDSHEQRC